MSEIITVNIDNVWRLAESFENKKSDGSILYVLNGLVQKAESGLWSSLKHGGYSNEHLEDIIISKNLNSLSCQANARKIIQICRSASSAWEMNNER